MDVEAPGFRLSPQGEAVAQLRVILTTVLSMPGWRNWQTQRTQNRLLKNQISDK